MHLCALRLKTAQTVCEIYSQKHVGTTCLSCRFWRVKVFVFFKKRLGYYTGLSTETTVESIKFLLLKLFMEEVKKPQLTIYHPVLLWDF